VLAGTKASMSWTDGKGRKTDSDEAGGLAVVEPELMLEMQASRPLLRRKIAFHTSFPSATHKRAMRRHTMWIWKTSFPRALHMSRDP